MTQHGPAIVYVPPRHANKEEEEIIKKKTDHAITVLALN